MKGIGKHFWRFSNATMVIEFGNKSWQPYTRQTLENVKTRKRMFIAKDFVGVFKNVIGNR